MAGYYSPKKFTKKERDKEHKERELGKVATALRATEHKNAMQKITLSDESKDIINILENTSENLFITGRAGTGKSTLLNYFREHTKKNVVVVAPTGVAALNVRGQTIHGFFKFKIGVTEHDVKKLNPDTLDGKMYHKIDTLIIDEISMVRADMFDCIEKHMRLNGKNPEEAFGGAQIIVIGDLFQLPPVVGYGEQHIFETKYESPYFFDSKAYKAGSFAIVELTHVYRQHDPHFIDILDKIRTGEAMMQHVEYINSRCYVESGAPQARSGYGRTLTSGSDLIYVDDDGLPVEARQGVNSSVSTHEALQEKSIDKEKSEKIRAIEELKNQFGMTTGSATAPVSSTLSTSGQGHISAHADVPLLSVYLVTTNALAESINAKKLQELKGDTKTYKGTLTGRFDQRNIPAPAELILKIGAQVMTLKNDPGGRWVNGDIGVVQRLNLDSVRIKFEDGHVEDVVGDSWEMVKYEYDSINDKLGSEVVGKYTQIPVKLAWAVTIHKSQGKTFDKATIDFGAGAFAHGQAYVALSRVRSLEGITLKTRLTPRDVRIDERVREFLMGSR